MSEMTDGFTRGSAGTIGPQIEEKLSLGEQVMLKVSGDSMRPTLKPWRDVAVLERLLDAEIRRGDILYFRSGRSQSGYALHRAVRVRGDTLTMNGDAQNWTEDISRGAVLARAVVLIRNGKLVNVDGFPYRAYVRLWGVTRPVRFTAFAIWRGIKRVIRRK